MPCGRILNTTKEKPKTINGKTFKWIFNPKTKQYVKFRLSK